MTQGDYFLDFAVLASAAGLVAVVFSRLGWPKVLGYILAGILMSEHTWGGSFLKDPNAATLAGQVGVVFLMFAMGLSFSPKEMRSVRTVAVPCAIWDTLVMIWLGYTVGTKVFGWSPGQSFFLGVAICDSATTLLAKVIDEMGWGRRAFAGTVLGTSVCEDIVCVGAIAVATGFAQGGRMSAGAFAMSLGGLAIFFLTVLVFGFVLVPRLLKSIMKRQDDEALVLTLMGICFFVSYFAYSFDYSLALGAFLVGLVTSVSEARARVEKLMEPLKAAYASVFFISIGLLVNPQALWMCLPQILLITAVVLVGKFLNNCLMSLAAGMDIKSSVQNGFALAQIGEFACLVAILYSGIGMADAAQMFPIAVGASLLTTLLNPFMIRVSDRVGDFAVRHTPVGIKSALSSYRAFLAKIGASHASPAFMLLKSAAMKLGIYAVLILSVSVACSILCDLDYARFSVFFHRHRDIFFFGVANLFAVAMVPMVLSSARALGEEVAVLLTGDGAAKWQVSMRQFVRFVVVVAVLALVFVEWTMINVSVLPVTVKLQGVSAVVVLCVGLAGWRFFVKAGRRATQRFQEALTAEERSEGLVRMTTISVPEGVVQHLRLAESSPAIGETVVTLDVRARTGASVLAVHRGGRIFRNIGPDWTFAAGDVLVVLGDQPQVDRLRLVLEARA